MKVAIVTAGNKGIGLEITKKLVENNYKVIVGARSNFLEKEFKHKITFLKVDLTKFGSHQKLVEEAIKIYGKLDLYVNNLGISEWRPIQNIDEEFLNKLISTNIYSAFWGCKASEKFLQDGSSIINISSIAGKRGSKNNSVYVATKFAMNGLTQSLAKELGPRNIRVNALCPVLIKTEGLSEALGKYYSPVSNKIDDFFEDFTQSQTALKRLPKGSEVAEMVVFLASSNASAITGQCINVDCGVFPQ